MRASDARLGETYGKNRCNYAKMFNMQGRLPAEANCKLQWMTASRSGIKDKMKRQRLPAGDPTSEER